MAKRISATNIKIKRAYEKPAAEDGLRILIDRLWPRGPTGFQAKVGVDLPKSVALHAFPQQTADNILTLAGMEYAKLHGRVLVARTRDRKIESIITPASVKS